MRVKAGKIRRTAFRTAPVKTDYSVNLLLQREMHFCSYHLDILRILSDTCIVPGDLAMNKHSPDWFWDGCEAQAPLHLLITLPGQPQIAQSVLRQPFAVVGRDRRAHLRLDDARVGLRHAYFQVIAGQLFVVDLGSPTGTEIKGNSVRAGWVPLGERVGIGPYALRWLKGDVPDPDGLGPGFDPRRQKQPGEFPTPLSLEFLNGKTAQQHWQVDRALTLIGSAPACKLRLRSSRVSAFHCSLVWTRRGAWVVDLLSERGVQVNGVPVTLASLEHDDRLQVGEFLIRVSITPPSLSANPAATLLRNSSALRLPALAPLDPAAVDPAHAALVPLMNQFGAMQEQMAEQFRQTLMMMFQMFSALHKDQMAFFQQEMDRVQQLTEELHLLRIEAARHPPAMSAPEPAVVKPSNSSSPAAPPESTPLPRQVPQTPPSAAPAAAAAPAGQDIHVWLCQRMAAVQEERQNRWQKLLALLGGKPADAV
jgi:pSer/pThr/pTyr-binding forkhead associated (FHA) protein